MRNQKLASRYAKSLLILAEEKNFLDAVYTDMKLIGDAISTTSELDIILKSPVIKSQKKIDIFNQIFVGKVNPLTIKFIDLLIKNSREFYLQNVIESFIQQYNFKMEIKTAYITTAEKLDPESLNRLKKITSKLKADSVKIVEIVDKSLIGGFRLNVDDMQVDASLKTKLEELKRNFSKNTYKSEL